MITLKEAKEWLRIFEDDEDNLIDSLIKSSVAIIKSATGVSIGYI
ncbi:head-tail connector protein, partial [Clostridium perfringens]